MKKFFYSFVALCAAISFTACSSDDDNETSADKSYGRAAVSSCATLGDELTSAYSVIGKSSLTSEQETYIKGIFANLVDNVIVPTYTSLADNTEDLEKTLNGLSTSTITQTQINKACEDFAKAREQWELSEAFLGGAASDFSIDPTIDSWPLSRSNLLNYFNGSLKLEDADESILGFHALEFVLFRDGSPRKVDEFQTNDTYTGFTSITGAQELKYAQDVCKLLKERTFELQVAWEGETSANADRVAVVKAAGLNYKTKKGYSFGDNLKNAGDENVSTFSTVKAAVEQLLSAEEGSAFGITNEVGTAKIGHPFTEGVISYVESPYSYRSITDFQDNIRSVRNVWYGTTTGSADSKVNSFYNFFASLSASTNTAVVNGFNNAISAIGSMPSPFVKYCCDIWGKTFSTEEYEGEDEE